VQALQMKPLRKILLVDDDKVLRSLLIHYLGSHGFDVHAVNDGFAMTIKLERYFYDLILLDWSLPDEDGLSICRRLSGHAMIPPIIMLTGNGREIDRISGLDAGADDYINKPFNLGEVKSRINAVLRRCSPVVASLPSKHPLSILFGPYSLDCVKRCLYKNDEKIDLTPGEFALLKILAQHSGKPMTREHLSYMIKGRDYNVADRFLDVQMARLRRLVEADPSRPIYLQTVRGVGYIMTHEVSVQ
jgi:two-component system phosphate regulon response regulator OmpR